MGEVEVYADLLFLINAGMDGLCFCLSAKLLHSRLTPWRLVLGSALGGLYAVVALLFEVGRGASLFLDLGVCFLLCLLVWSGGWRRWPLFSAVYLLISMVMGGVMTALYNWLNQAGVAAWLPDGEEGLSTWLFLLIALAGGAVSLWGGRLARRSASTTTCEVEMTLDGKAIRFVGLVDTGNLLRDPVGGRAVICVGAGVLDPILSPGLRAAVKTGGLDPGVLTRDSDKRRLRLIPTSTATGTSLLVGILPDALSLTIAGRRGENTRQVDAVVAVAPAMVDGESGALIPSELIV